MTSLGAEGITALAEGLACERDGRGMGKKMVSVRGLRLGARLV